MAATTITSKGQVTIPSDIRERMRWKTGDRLDFSVEANGRVVVELLAEDARSLRGALGRKDRPTVSIEEMDQAVGQYLSKKHRSR